jgi:hypothetical protein
VSLDAPFVDVLTRYEALGSDEYRIDEDELGGDRVGTGDRVGIGDRVTVSPKTSRSHGGSSSRGVSPRKGSARAAPQAR